MLTVLLVTAALLQSAGPDSVEAVDLYGIRRLDRETVQRAIGVSVGDRTPDALPAIRRRVLAISGVADADVSVVCCGEKGGALLYVGIRERNEPAPSFAAAPRGAVRLSREVVTLGDRFDRALMNAVQRGVTDDDVSAGYALSADSSVRTLQQQFREMARTQLPTLRRVLGESGDAAQRALAAQIIAYGSDRGAVVQLLAAAVRDPDERVRNNAARALALLAQWANEHPTERLTIPSAPFIAFLQSAQWTDRNKAVFVLLPLTASREPALLERLRCESLPSLVEMARWANPGHALPAYLVLARVIGVSDDEAFAAWTQGRREEIIRRAAEASSSPHGPQP